MITQVSTRNLDCLSAAAVIKRLIPWKTLNRDISNATSWLSISGINRTSWASPNESSLQGYCIVRCARAFFLIHPLRTGFFFLFLVILVQTPTWWSQHGMVKIHGFHSCCHGDHTVSILTVCLQEAALCQSLSCQLHTDIKLLVFPQTST